VADATDRYITPAFGESDSAVAVYTPQEFWPRSGTMTFDDSTAEGVTLIDAAIVNYTTGAHDGDSVVVFGYSSSARIASIQKRNMIENYDPETSPVAHFFLMGNPNRPDGGILMRFKGLRIPVLDVTFDGATPTDSPNGVFETVDATQQHDGWSDFPRDLWNPLALANALAGIYYLHPNYNTTSLDDALYQGSMGDTDYYIIPNRRLPILMPFAQMGVPDPILAVLDAPLRVIIEWSYDREANPGVPTPVQLFAMRNPIGALMNLALSIPTGIDDGLQAAGGDRVLGTTPAGPFGVGGPTLPPATTAEPIAAAEANGGDADPAPVAAPATEPTPSLAEASTGEPATAEPVTAEPVDSTGDSSSPGVTQPDPVRPKVRGPIEFDSPQRPAVRPSGPQQLKRLFNALTGQQPEPAAETGETGEAGAEPSEAENDAA
jgi:hypothetical protein